MFSKDLIDKKLIIALNSWDYTFSVSELPDMTLYKVNHLTIKVSEAGVTITGYGIREVYKAIDFQIRPALEREVIEEVMSFLGSPEKKSAPLWRLFLEMIKK